MCCYLAPSEPQDLPLLFFFALLQSFLAFVPSPFPSSLACVCSLRASGLDSASLLFGTVPQLVFCHPGSLCCLHAHGEAASCSPGYIAPPGTVCLSAAPLSFQLALLFHFALPATGTCLQGPCISYAAIFQRRVFLTKCCHWAVTHFLAFPCLSHQFSTQQTPV